MLLLCCCCILCIDDWLLKYKLNFETMEPKNVKLVLSIMALFLIVVNAITVAQPPRVSVTVAYTKPVWGPTYYTGVRYYYFPDIEVYYDLSTSEYVFFREGRWIVSPTLPPMYSGFDLRSGFVVSLNTSVYRPWLRHSYYCSHYPRYFYKYRYANDYRRMRGYNENDRRPYLRDNERPNRPGNYQNDNRYNNNQSGRSDDYERSSRYDQNNEHKSHRGGNADRRGYGRR